eukprot:TRINITY_DN528_c1_g1_i1.p1 TRINITY_DN528_c1_g1~~TRINITY_DN528_c1_g1_i1.p1  ORF type:complete len:317 (-),score=33.35 TRINITY_DN528_c1_g1_i1:68-1018(-)
MNPIIEDLIRSVTQNQVKYISVTQQQSTPCFYYSAGLILRNHPEIVIVGLEECPVAYALIEDVGNRVIAGEVFRPGDFIDTRFGARVRIGEVDLVKSPLMFGGMAAVSRFFNVKCSAVQIIWSDLMGVFPDMPDCDDKVVKKQWLLDGKSKCYRIQDVNEVLQVCFHCGAKSERTLCSSCAAHPDEINDGKSHGSTCPDCFERVYAKSLVGWLAAVDEHNDFCEKHPELWSSDRFRLDCRIIHPLCRSVARRLYLLSSSITTSDEDIFQMLQEEAKIKFNTDLMYLSRRTQEGLVNRAQHILSKLYQKNTRKTRSF